MNDCGCYKAVEPWTLIRLERRMYPHGCLVKPPDGHCGVFSLPVASRNAIPTSSSVSSDAVFVSQTEFDIAGRPFETTDPAGAITRSEFDDAGRTTKVIRNFGGSDTQTVRTEYSSVGQLSKQIAENGEPQSLGNNNHRVRTITE